MTMTSTKRHAPTRSSREEIPPPEVARLLGTGVNVPACRHTSTSADTSGRLARTADVWVPLDIVSSLNPGPSVSPVTPETITRQLAVRSPLRCQTTYQARMVEPGEGLHSGGPVLEAVTVLRTEHARPLAVAVAIQTGPCTVDH